MLAIVRKLLRYFRACQHDSAKLILNLHFAG